MSAVKKLADELETSTCSRRAIPDLIRAADDADGACKPGEDEIRHGDSLGFKVSDDKLSADITIEGVVGGLYVRLGRAQLGYLLATMNAVHGAMKDA